MRKTIATALTVALGAVGLLSAPASYAEEPPTSPAPALRAPAAAVDMTAPAAPAAPAPLEALTTARRVLKGNARAGDPSATLALRDLWLRRDTLQGRERRQADAMLARPSDGPWDPAGFGYPDPGVAQRTCNGRLCVHFVPPGAGPDAVPTLEWASLNLAVMDAVWSHEVGRLGFRAPISDRGADGTPQFDVYLKDLGGSLYGYCAAERRGGKGRTASGYCVLDNNFSTAKFAGSPEGNLRVTAAHEFFHAVQYAYDFGEDPWMMESTATWVEERVATDVNDNRQYLVQSQLYAPQLPLDLFVQGRTHQYGNWIFWEYLSKRFGTSIVKKAWKAAGPRKRSGGKYSFQALNKVLRKKGGLTKVYAQFAADNLVPFVTYPEGGAYAVPLPKRIKVLTKRRRDQTYKTRVSHMASTSFRFVPDSSLSRKKWKLRLKVAGPAKRTSPAAAVLIHLQNGRVKRKMVKLNRRGDGSIRVPFSSRRVAAVSVTVVNASTRMRCNRRTYLACAGKPRDNGLRFRVKARAVKR